REYTNIDLVDWLKRLQTLPIGEIHLVSVDSDGMNKGVDFELINLARDYVNIPLIYGGGFNHLIDDVNKLSNIIDGLVIASSIHNNDLNLLKLSQRST
ncbi:HisA/HisF-related TIM barrel protein, partial [bacterium]|nr:HisA/HisF-related TIM barrel protein [bacterium]